MRDERPMALEHADRLCPVAPLPSLYEGRFLCSRLPQQRRGWLEAQLDSGWSEITGRLCLG